MRTRGKLTLEEKFALALDLIKRERSLDEIREHYRVSHTTAYKIRNAFLEGGRSALSGGRERGRGARDLEARVSALETVLHVNPAAPRKLAARAEGAAALNGVGHERRLRAQRG